MNTLPLWAITYRIPLDPLRKLIRETPALQLLGQKFGTVKIYTDAEAKQIKDAFEAKKGKSRKAVAHV